jgi:aminomethyltransferase
MVDFAGWHMPVQYQGVLDEHLAVRTRAGLFDVSHMGEVEVKGPKALDAMQNLTCNDVSRLSPGQAQYTALTTEKGTFVDDVIIYRRREDLFLICVNASNQDKDFAWIASHMPQGAEALNLSDQYAQLAIQGPDAERIITGLADADVQATKFFSFEESAVAGVPAIIARTGYTGEDGFEIYCEASKARDLWDTLMAVGSPFGLTPCGLAARDTLRLEAGLMLYGNDIDETTTVLESGLNFILKLKKGDFIGRDALVRQKESGLKKKLQAFEMIERGIARHGYPVSLDGKTVGSVTSGTFGPHVRKNIGMAYVPVQLAAPGCEFDIIIRGKPVRARAVKPPFYKRQADG